MDEDNYSPTYSINTMNMEKELPLAQRWSDLVFRVCAHMQTYTKGRHEVIP